MNLWELILDEETKSIESEALKSCFDDIEI